MSIPVLNQVYDEVRRLAIAGSVVAGGDFRLKKLVPPLEQAGQKAPVFAKVAQSVTALVESNEKTSAAALLDLSTLINAILYTQGETGTSGELVPIETTDLGQQQTQASARILKPLLEALSKTGSGRLEIIKDSFERGAFRDLRLVKPALAALDDSYGEIGDFIADKVLPLYGKAILPELRAKFDVKGRGGHLRRLGLMHRLDPDGTRPVVKKALDGGSKEMKVVAIECLGASPEDLPYLLEQTKAKAREVRQAALKALGRVDSGQAVGAIEESIREGDIDLAIQPVRETTSPRLVKFVLDEAEAQAAALLAKKEKDKKVLGKQVDRLLSLLECLRERDDEPTSSFLQKLFARRDELSAIKSDPGGTDIQQRLVQIMSVGPKGAQSALVDAHASLAPDDLSYSFEAARRSRNAASVFEMFSPYLTAKVDEKKKGRDGASARRQAIVSSLTFGSQSWYYDRDPESEHALAIRSLDPRWLDLAVKQQNLEVVMALARPGHAGANDLLAKAFDEKSRSSKTKDSIECSQLLRTMVRVEHPSAAKVVIDTIGGLAKMSSDSIGYWIPQLIPDLPKNAIPELEALLPKLPNKAADQLLDCLDQLKNKA